MKERKELKAKYPNSHISVQYPAKLIQDGRLVKDVFPDWYSFMKSDRLDDSLYGRTRSENPRVDHSERVFESDSESSVNDIETEGTVMQTQAQIHSSPSPRAQVSAASIFGVENHNQTREARNVGTLLVNVVEHRIQPWLISLVHRIIPLHRVSPSVH